MQTRAEVVTREIAIRNLQKYIGEDLRSLALTYGITTYETGKQNKGWKGLVLERLAGLQNNGAREPDGDTYELKSVSYKKTPLGVFVPQETMAITMLNPQALIDQSFFESYCWHKLKSMVFCAVEWTGHNAQKAKLLKVTDFDFSVEDELVKELKEDYDYIRNKLIMQGFPSLTGKDGKWIQARTKGPGHGSISRAFYARKGFLTKIFNEE